MLNLSYVASSARLDSQTSGLCDMPVAQDNPVGGNGGLTFELMYGLDEESGDVRFVQVPAGAYKPGDKYNGMILQEQ